MSLVISSSHPTNIPANSTRIAQLSAIGRLSDAVLLDLLKIEAGLPASDRTGLERAKALFLSAAKASEEPQNVWDTPSLVDDLMRLSTNQDVSSESISSPEPGTTEVRDWFQHIADLLAEVATASPSPAEVIREVRFNFSKLSRLSLQSAVEINGTRSF